MKDKKLDVKDKKVLVMGLGLHGGGAGTVEFLARRGAAITVTDLRTRRQLAPTIRALKHLKGIRYVLGEHRMEDFLAADLIIKNPGVRRDSPYLKAADARGIPITSDMDIFFAACPARMIGITGTRGKSTTTYLIWLFLKTKFGSRVHYAGNIRRSVLTILPRIKKDDVVVLELSSFQLQDLGHEKKSPAIAVITNLLRDHLNWHRDVREYYDAKSVIFRFQKSGDRLFYNGDDAAVRRLVSAASRHVGTRAASPLATALQAVVDRNLGAHYRSSVALAIAVARHFGISDTAITKTLRNYKGLPARQEFIAIVRGVRFINDTTATIPDAAIAAIRRFRPLAGPDHKLILLAGGQDKKLDFRAMIKEIKKQVDRIVFLPGSATERIKNKVASIQMLEAKSMAEAVDAAYGMAEKGDYIVLSPGATSFGLFLNEFDRGDRFVHAVKELAHKNLFNISRYPA